MEVGGTSGVGDGGTGVAVGRISGVAVPTGVGVKVGFGVRVGVGTGVGARAMRSVSAQAKLLARTRAATANSIVCRFGMDWFPPNGFGVRSGQLARRHAAPSILPQTARGTKQHGAQDLAEISAGGAETYLDLLRWRRWRLIWPR